MVQALGSECPPYDTVCRWVLAALDSKEVEDAARSGRSVLTITAAQVGRVATLQREDRLLTTGQVAASVGISRFCSQGHRG